MEGAHGTDQEEFVDRSRQRFRGVDRHRDRDVLTLFNNTETIPYKIRLAIPFHLAMAEGKGGRYALMPASTRRAHCPAIATLRPTARHGRAALR